MVRFWRWGSASPRQDEIIASQREKLQEETTVVQAALFAADLDQRVAGRKLVEAQEVSHEARKVAGEIRRQEEMNGLAGIFHRGLAGGAR